MNLAFFAVDGHYFSERIEDKHLVEQRKESILEPVLPQQKFGLCLNILGLLYKVRCPVLQLSFQ